jgi:hypothetical protein
MNARGGETENSSVAPQQERLGHCDDISMTMRYTYSAPERSLDALCRLEH